MPETAQQYVARILSNLAGKDPLNVLEQTPSALARLLDGVPEATLCHRPAPDKWSLKEIAYHLADVELAVGFRVRFILGAPGAPIQAFDQDSWVAAERCNQLPLAAALDAHRALRTLNLQLYRSLSPAQWEQFGLHSERGQETVRQIVSLAAGHDLNHLRQIESLLSAARAATG